MLLIGLEINAKGELGFSGVTGNGEAFYVPVWGRLCRYLKIISPSDCSNPEKGPGLHLNCFTESHKDYEG